MISFWNPQAKYYYIQSMLSKILLHLSYLPTPYVHFHFHPQLFFGYTDECRSVLIQHIYSSSHVASFNHSPLVTVLYSIWVKTYYSHKVLHHSLTLFCSNYLDTSTYPLWVQKEGTCTCKIIIDNNYTDIQRISHVTWLKDGNKGCVQMGTVDTAIERPSSITANSFMINQSTCGVKVKWGNLLNKVCMSTTVNFLTQSTKQQNGCSRASIPDNEL